VVLEAWANDRPVVANRIGAIPELVQQGVNGYLVAPGDPAEMADAILKLLENPAEAASMGRAGHERLLEYYCEQRWVAQIKNLFEKIRHNIA
jgi:glycosyltransferase involved in cell wall biosynthesis